MPPKKGKHLLYRRPAGRRSNITYTKIRPTRYVQKRNLKRPAASAFLSPSIGVRQFRLACRKFGLLPRRRVCDRCGGQLNIGKYEPELNMNGYRCKSRGCQARISRIHGHPIFQIAKSVIPVNQQFLILRAYLNGISATSMHLQFNLAHTTIGRYISRIRSHIVSWVRQHQKTISFEDHTNLVEVEADECTVARFPSGKKEHPVSWIGYVGMVRRGHAATLVLEPLPIRNTRQRAPGPGPISSEEWAPIKEHYLANKNLVLHTDSARAYKAPITGVVHTRVVHQVKKVNGVWLPPTFSRDVKIRCPLTSKKVKVRSGTQTIDGFWTHLRGALRSRPSNKPEVVEEYVRMAQYKYWSSGHDPLEFFRRTMPVTLDGWSSFE